MRTCPPVCTCVSLRLAVTATWLAQPLWQEQDTVAVSLVETPGRGGASAGVRSPASKRQCSPEQFFAEGFFISGRQMLLHCFLPESLHWVAASRILPGSCVYCICSWIENLNTFILLLGRPLLLCFVFESSFSCSLTIFLFTHWQLLQ